MSGIILPGQQPSREVMKAAGDFLATVISQYPGMAAGIKHGFSIQIVGVSQIATMPGQVLFSLSGDVQHARPFQGGVKP